MRLFYPVIAFVFATLAAVHPVLAFPVVLNVDAATDGLASPTQTLLAGGVMEVGWLTPGTTQGQIQALAAAGDFAGIDAVFHQVVTIPFPSAAIDYDSQGGQYFESVTVVPDGDAAGLAAFQNATTGAAGKAMFGWVRDAVNPLATTQMAFIANPNFFPPANDPLGSDFAETFYHSAPAVAWVGTIVPVTVGGAIDNSGAGNTAGDGLGGTGSGFVLQLASVVTTTEASLQFGAGTASVAENAGSLTVTVTRTGKLDNAVSVQFATADASAQAGADYTATSGTLNFAANDVSETIVVPVADRAGFQGERSFAIALSSAAPAGAAALGSPATIAVTIQDDEQAMSGALQFGAATYSAAENAGSVAIAVRRVGGSDGAVSATFATAPGTATSPADYTAVSQTVSFAAGDAADKTVSVPLNDDAVFEGVESFTVTLSAPTGGATLGSPTSATVTIADNETPPTAGSLSFSAAAFSGNESAGSVVIGVARTGGSTGAVSVQYATADGAAAAPGDYAATSGTLSWSDGETGTKTFTVAVVDNSVDAADKTFSVALSNPTGGAAITAPTSAAVTIVDDDTAGTFSFTAATATVSEGAGQIALTIARTLGTAGVVEVLVSTSAGPAPAAGTGEFEALANRVVSFSDGQTTATVTIAIADDAVFSGNRNFQATLSAGSGGAAIGAAGTATVTITDNDTPLPGRFSFGAATYQAAEGAPTVTLTVIRTDGSDGEARVTYTVVNGTAIAPGDFPATSGALTFAHGETSRTFPVTIHDDTIAENEESFAVRLSNPTGGAALGARTSAIVTIADNEPTFRLSAPTYSATEGSTLSVVVRRENGLSTPRSIDYRIANGTALAGRDFRAASGSLLFDAGVAEQTLSIPILDDAAAEGAETFKVTLVKVNAADLQVGLSAPSVAVVTIARSDATEQPDLSASGGSGYVGGGIFNGTATGQSVIRSVKGNASAGFTIRLKNAGTAPDSIVLRGIAGGSAPTGTVKITLSGIDVTARVLSSGGYTRSNIAARGVLEFKVTVSARSGNAFAGYGLTLTASSASTVTKSDTVRVGVVRR